jgi:hypothetical protein
MRLRFGLAGILAGLLPLAGVAQTPSAPVASGTTGTAVTGSARIERAQTARTESAAPQATNPEPRNRASVKQDLQANQPDAVVAPAPLQAINGTENLDAVLELMRNRPREADPSGMSAALASLAGRQPGTPTPPNDQDKKDQREQLGRALSSATARGW